MRIVASPPGPYQPGTSVVLNVADAPTGVAAYEWQASGATIPGASGSSYRLAAGAAGTAVEYTVVAKDAAGAESARASFTATVGSGATAPGPGGGDPVGPEPLLVYSAGFAVLAMVFSVLLLAAGLTPLSIVLWRVAVRSTGAGTEATVTIGGMVAIGLLIIGGVIACAGIFGALLEVRARLRTPKDRAAFGGRGGLPDVKGVIEAIGKLRGSALIMVIACVPLLAAAWIGNTAVDQSSPTTTTTTAPTSTTVAPGYPTASTPAYPGDTVAPANYPASGTSPGDG